MTFNPAPWAVDGARTNAALARLATSASVGAQEGIVAADDLKVTQLGVAGNGLLISDGAAIILNRYQGPGPNEVYVVDNTGTHTVTSASMPATNPVTKYYLVCITIGDPEFSQLGHPWMGAGDPPDGEAETFEYVRPFLLECSSTTTKFSQLGLDFPGLALARIAVPPSTTTITNSMITDLRKLARPRQSQEMFVSDPGFWTSGSPQYILKASTYGNWGSYVPSVTIPTWARRAILVVTINGVQILDTSVNIKAGVRTQLGSAIGPATAIDVPSSAGAIRMNLQTAGTYDVSAIAGTTVDLRVEGYENTPTTPTNNQTLRLTEGSQMVFDVRFFEE